MENAGFPTWLCIPLLIPAKCFVHSERKWLTVMWEAMTIPKRYCKKCVKIGNLWAACEVFLLNTVGACTCQTSIGNMPHQSLSLCHVSESVESCPPSSWQLFSAQLANIFIYTFPSLPSVTSLQSQIQLATWYCCVISFTRWSLTEWRRWCS